MFLIAVAERIWSQSDKKFILPLMIVSIILTRLIDLVFMIFVSKESSSWSLLVLKLKTYHLAEQDMENGPIFIWVS